MIRYVVWLPMVLSVALLVGCEKKEEPKAPKPATPAGGAMDRAADAAKTAAQKAQEEVRKAQEEARKSLETANVQAGAAVKEAQDALGKLLQDIKDNKLPEAEQQLKSLQDMAKSLPQDLKDKIEAAAKALELAKEKAKSEM